MSKKTYAAVRIIIFSLVTLILCAVLAWGISFDTLSLGGISFGTSRFTYDDTDFLFAEGSVAFPAGQVSSVDIEWVAGSVEIVRGKGDEISVSESADDSLDDEDLLGYRLKNGRLEIKYCKSTFKIGLFQNDPEKHLVVSLPDKLYDQIAVDAVSADVNITGLESARINLVTVSGNTLLTDVALSNALDYEGVSGNFSAENLQCHALNVENVSGLVKLNGSVAASADLETVSGDIHLTSTEWIREIDGESVSANLYITLPAGSSIDWELESASGRIESDFDHVGHGSPASFDTVSGNVYLKKG